MKKNEKNIKIHCLSNKFYLDYPSEKFPEILKKQLRPYNIVLIEIRSDCMIGIPFRSYMKHKNGFCLSKKTLLDGRKPGLDYSKLVILKKGEYINLSPAFVDKNEMTVLNQNIAKIVKEVTKYINDYVAHVKGERRLQKRDFERKYEFSTLKYFHSELNINL